ncbi:MAG: carbonic anhydrase [Bacteroidetes bacterium]|nr:carbonic anhydrase [Bacteroidota bacterium]
MLSSLILFANGDPTGEKSTASTPAPNGGDGEYVTQTKETQAKTTPEMAVKMLKEGNERFVNDEMINRDLMEQVEQTSTGQYPIAAVVSCIDSRIPTEIVFDQGVGDIFNARIAGNFVNTDILGSLEFACKVAGAKAIVVMGHTSCGAVKGAVDYVELGNLTSMLDHIEPAIDAVKDIKDNRNSKNPEFVQKVSDKNVELTIEKIRSDSDVLRDMHDKGEIAIVGAMYDVETGKVTFF